MGLTEEEAKQLLVEIEASAQLRPGPSQRMEPPRAPLPVAATTSAVPMAPEGSAVAQDVDLELKSDRYLVDGLVDVTEAAQSAADSRGVVVATTDGRLLLAPVGKLSRSKEPAPSPIAELPDGVASVAVGRGPSLTEEHAYWIRDRNLHQHVLPGSQQKQGSPSSNASRIVATDARVATRVSALTVTLDGEQRDVVAYIGVPSEPGQPLVARVWSGSESASLSEPGSAALSVQLARRGSTVLAYSLEGRTSMSILHERELGFDGDALKLGPDRVVWVGGAATPTTELRVVGRGDDLVGLLPIEQDATHFGLALLALSQVQGDEPAPHLSLVYPNGMDYAPTSGAVVCGRLVALFARPSAALPHSPQELVLGEVDERGFAHELVLGRSKVFYDLSIAPLAGGALVSYVADRRTWARTLRCVD